MTPNKDAAAAMLHGIGKTLVERPDVRGVLPLADVLAESVRWSA